MMQYRTFSASQLSRRWLVVAPHPDDEVFGCSLLMRAIERAGGAIIVAWLTDGGASHGPLSISDRAALVARRQREAIAGLEALGVVPLATCFLGHADGALASPRAQAAARDSLLALCNEHHVQMLAVTSVDDNHSDHRAAATIAATIAAALQLPSFAYPVSALFDGAALGSMANAMAVIDASSAAYKRAAVACHASQMANAGAQFPLSTTAIERFCTSPEYFVPIVS